MQVNVRQHVNSLRCPSGTAATSAPCYLRSKSISHADTVVPDCFKEDNAIMQVNGKGENLTSAVPKTLEPMVTEICTGDEVVDRYHCAKFHYDPIRGFLPHPRVRIA